ncbi:hypothetical protein SLEP1_g19406 [Rubroshorea leprosula]|nr:hypothetical protein SLEP1_g19406 [Rubroshorea leprosula]
MEMRERGRERVRGGRDGHKPRTGRTTLGREHAGSRGRSQQRRFQQVGQRQMGQRVYAIYNPNRKSRNGTKFRFVRFLDVKNTRELEKNLDHIWIRGRKLWVNLPRYEEGKIEKMGSRYRQIAEPITQQRSYAEVVKGQTEKKQMEEGRTRFRKQEEKRPRRNTSRNCSN